MRQRYPGAGRYQLESSPCRETQAPRGRHKVATATPNHMPIPQMTHERPCCGVSTNIEDYFLTRRRFLSRVGMGLGALGLTTMLDPRDLFAGTGADGTSASDNPLAPRAP